MASLLWGRETCNFFFFFLKKGSQGSNLKIVPSLWVLACETKAHVVRLYGFGLGRPGRSAWPCHIGLMCEVTGIIVFCDQALSTTGRILSEKTLLSWLLTHERPEECFVNLALEFSELSKGFTVVWKGCQLFSLRAWINLSPFAQGSCHLWTNADHICLGG